MAIETAMEALRFDLSWFWTRLTLSMTISPVSKADNPTSLPTTMSTSVESQAPSADADSVRSSTSIISDASIRASDQPINPSNVAEDETQYPGGASLLFAFLAAGLALILNGFDTGVMGTSVPSITDEFGTIADVGWYSAAFRLTLCSFQFMFGRMYQVWNIKPIFIAGLVLFLTGDLLAGLAPTSKALVAARAITGFGCAAVISGCFAILNTAIPRRRRPMFLATVAFLEELSGAIAPVIGGAITHRLGWRWCFFIQLPFGLVTILAIAVFYKSNATPRYADLPLLKKVRKLDLVGTFLFVPGITSLLLALQFGGTKFGWGDGRLIACFVISAVLICLFVWWQIRRQDDATLPPRIAKNRSVLAGMLFSGFNSSATIVVQYYLPIYFQTVLQLDAQQSGFLLLPSLISFMMAILGGGFLSSLIGYYVAPMMLTSLITPIAIGMLSTSPVLPSSSAIIGWQIAHGAASGIGWQGPQQAMQAVLDQADLSFGVACVQFAQGFMTAVSIPAAQNIFSQLLERDLMKYAPGVNGTLLASMGLSDLRHKVQASQLDGTLLGFDKALMGTLYLPTALACVTMVGTLGIEWKNLKNTGRTQ